MRASSFLIPAATVLASKPAAAAVLGSIVPEPAGLTFVALAAAAGFLAYQARKRR